jgi:hypothetical protein
MLTRGLHTTTLFLGIYDLLIHAILIAVCFIEIVLPHKAVIFPPLQVALPISDRGEQVLILLLLD